VRSSDLRPVVVSTRDEDPDGPFACALEAAGCRVRSLPVTTVRVPEGIALLKSRLRDLDSYAWIAFTSRRGVEAAWSLPEMTETWASASHRPRVAAVGGATAAALEALGVMPDLVPSVNTGDALAEAIATASAPSGRTRVLWLCAARPYPSFSDRISRAGFELDRVAIYSVTAPPPFEIEALTAAVTRGEIAAVCFFAPSVAVSVGRALGQLARVALSQTLVASFGPSTSARLREVGVPPGLESPRTDAVTFAGAVAAAFVTARAGGQS
jgi:uroporphyrinogen III methyltransferase/synthase